MVAPARWRRAAGKAEERRLGNRPGRGGLTTVESDEHFAWNAALVIMALLSLLVIVAMVLRWSGFGVVLFFSDEFVVSLVYIPTLVLVLGWLAERRESRAISQA